ncbi:MAG: histidine kinase [Verrucomicrobiales bacterium]|nr:histidine kinase [Verrucomicrobiales bacterium]
MNRAGSNGRIARKVAVVATAVVLWGGLVLLFAAPLALTSSISWRQAVGFGSSFWALWLLFLPAVVWLSFRFPIERRRLSGHVSLHVLACLLIVATNRASFRVVSRFSPAPARPEAPGRSPGPPPNRLGPPAALGVFLALRAALDVLVYGALAGGCQAIRVLRRSLERERRAAELEARFTHGKLQALRMQLNPHFLFNTLNSIATLVYVNPRAADEMLGDLSGLLRRSLDSMEEQEIPLAQELEFIGAYLRIEQKRLGDRLRLEQNVPADLLKALVPALILQPLVENAIRHGIEPQRGPGLISVEARRQGRHLRLTVRDNGSGMPGEGIGRPAGCGIGLANTRARLQALYGGDQRFSFGKAEPRGCRVEVLLPCHLAPVPATGDPSEPVT